MTRWIPGIFLLLWIPWSLQASPWTRAPGEVYLQASEQFTRGGPGRGEVPGNWIIASALYGEIGLIQGLNARFYLPLVYTSRTWEGQEPAYLFSPGDAELGLQTGRNGVIPVSLRVALKLPLYPPEVAGETSVETTAHQRPGDPQLDLAAFGSVGHSWSGGRWYGFGELGYRRRRSVPAAGVDLKAYWLADEVPYQLEVGRKVGTSFAIVRLFGYKGIGEKTEYDRGYRRQEYWAGALAYLGVSGPWKLLLGADYLFSSVNERYPSQSESLSRGYALFLGWAYHR